MIHKPPSIEHDPDAKAPRDRWWPHWLAVALMWVGYLTFHEFDLWSLSLGGVTVGLLATWAIEITGNKTPEFMKTKR
ncbi:MAG TPA: hypothetical protein VIK75_10075 [Calditerricola sp.]